LRVGFSPRSVPRRTITLRLHLRERKEARARLPPAPPAYTTLLPTIHIRSRNHSSLRTRNMTNSRVPLQPFPLGHKIPPLKTVLYQIALHRPVELAAFIRHKASLLNLERQLSTSSTSQSQRFIIEWELFKHLENHGWQ